MFDMQSRELDLSARWDNIKLLLTFIFTESLDPLN